MTKHPIEPVNNYDVQGNRILDKSEAGKADTAARRAAARTPTQPVAETAPSKPFTPKEPVNNYDVQGNRILDKYEAGKADTAARRAAARTPAQPEVANQPSLRDTSAAAQERAANRAAARAEIAQTRPISELTKEELAARRAQALESRAARLQALHDGRAPTDFKAFSQRVEARIAARNATIPAMEAEAVQTTTSAAKAGARGLSRYIVPGATLFLGGYDISTHLAEGDNRGATGAATGTVGGFYGALAGAKIGARMPGGNIRVKAAEIVAGTVVGALGYNIADVIGKDAYDYFVPQITAGASPLQQALDEFEPKNSWIKSLADKERAAIKKILNEEYIGKNISADQAIANIRSKRDWKGALGSEEGHFQMLAAMVLHRAEEIAKQKGVAIGGFAGGAHGVVPLQRSDYNGYNQAMLELKMSGGNKAGVERIFAEAQNAAGTKDMTAQVRVIANHLNHLLEKNDPKDQARIQNEVQALTVLYRTIELDRLHHAGQQSTPVANFTGDYFNKKVVPFVNHVLQADAAAQARRNAGAAQPQNGAAQPDASAQSQNGAAATNPDNAQAQTVGAASTDAGTQSQSGAGVTTLTIPSGGSLSKSVMGNEALMKKAAATYPQLSPAMQAYEIALIIAHANGIATPDKVQPGTVNVPDIDKALAEVMKCENGKECAPVQYVKNATLADLLAGLQAQGTQSQDAAKQALAQALGKIAGDLGEIGKSGVLQDSVIKDTELATIGADLQAILAKLPQDAKQIDEKTAIAINGAIAKIMPKDNSVKMDGDHMLIDQAIANIRKVVPETGVTK